MLPQAGVGASKTVDGAVDDLDQVHWHGQGEDFRLSSISSQISCNDQLPRSRILVGVLDSDRAGSSVERATHLVELAGPPLVMHSPVEAGDPNGERTGPARGKR